MEKNNTHEKSLFIPNIESLYHSGYFSNFKIGNILDLQTNSTNEIVTQEINRVKSWYKSGQTESSSSSLFLNAHNNKIIKPTLLLSIEMDFVQFSELIRVIQ